ncbi:MAG: nitrite/sulfite reductase [Chloroflexi bacterium]|nr:nitrite/sulfite reductase [Chloroflexota bacterium]MCI0793722.1 nitrite/sulfite reductase [Chloroflexota bacterium]MCI0799240.1 nitrite/sulfite reductase [Chloroflexota bacterium]MCI0825704.1 nitrite/sulfite reductase [Chloroflexota bacterium]MCI0866640.1 nitrite/sulfite reductase [Chloroflexota bacterium]
MTSPTRSTQSLTQEDIYAKSQELAPSAPGVIPFIDEEIQNLEVESAKYQSGEQDTAQFTPFRLKQGVYGQRQADVQMIRVKIPGGILTAEGLEVLGTITERYAPLQKGHLTTRENVQIHHIPLPDCPAVLRLLGEAGLSTREACGNTVRNVVSSPTAGVCADEVFDPSPYLAAYVRFGVRHPITQNFPRKFKTAFTGCESHDTVAAAIQDLTFVSQVRQVDGQEQRGFKIYVGGGTSIMPRLAKHLYEFVAEEDYLRLSLAIWTVFNDAQMLRKNRMMARIKVLIDKIGLDAFRELVDAELEKIGPIDPKPLMQADEILRETPPSLDPLSLPHLELGSPATQASGNGESGATNGHEGGDEYNRWRETNVVAQKQDGYYLAYVKLTRGDITHTQFMALGDIVRRFTGGRARTTQEQNLALRWIPEEGVHAVWMALKAIGLAEPDVHTITDVVSCPGTDTCKLGITSSMGLASAIRDELNSWNGLLEDEGVRDIRIKISGCPNGCGLHHIANIGFHGAAVKGPDGEQIPAYELFLGGNYGDNRVEDSRIGTRIPRVKIPAKAVPTVLREITGYYKENHQEQESFNQFLDRVGLETMTEVAVQAQKTAQAAEAGSDLYFDWERTNIYKLERGEGECAV